MPDLHLMIEKTAREVFSINYLRPFQLHIICNILERVKKPNLLAILPTGAGKSLCFMLPAVLLDGLTIIVYPLLSLMRDQEHRFRSLGIPCHVLMGGMEWKTKDDIFTDLAQKKVRILITNMEMLSQEPILSRLKSMRISLLVLDEAHTIISWGKTFRPVYNELGRISGLLNPGRIIAFTATSDEDTTNALKKEVLGEDALVVYGGLDRPNIIYHRLSPVFPLLDIISILTPPERRPALVFCMSRTLAEKLSNRLSGQFRTRFYHAGMDKVRRLETERDFLDDREGVMFCTCAYGMGVDKKDLRTVIHYSLPESASDYLQESGRIGRDGRKSHAYAFLGNSYRPGPLEEVFASDSCMRENLIRAMGQVMDSSCEGCDVCDGNRIVPKGVENVRKALRVPYLRKRSDLIRILKRNPIFHLLDEYEIGKGIDRLLDRGVIRRRFGRLKWVGMNIEHGN